MQVSLANHSEVHLFQMADGQVVIVGGHDDQGVLDSVELINLTSSRVGNGFPENNLSTILIWNTNLKKVREMPTTGSHTPLWGGSCWLQDGSLLVRRNKGPVQNFVKLVYCVLMGPAHDNGHSQVGGGMDGLFLSHANAYSLTYPGLNWQVNEEYTWITNFGRVQ